MKLVQAGTLAVIVACSAAVFAQGPGPRRDGNWDVTIEMQMPNMPNMPQGMTIPPIKTTQCITKEQAADPSKAMPTPPQRGGGPAPDCKVSDYKTVGNKVTWSMSCTGAAAASGTGEFVYTDDAYTGQMVMNVERGGQPMAMTMKYTGKRLGDCTK
jgi:Protein of unknown function (DUF3617)